MKKVPQNKVLSSRCLRGETKVFDYFNLEVQNVSEF